MIKIFFILFFLLLIPTSYSKCNPHASRGVSVDFIDLSSKKVHAAALGSFYKKDNEIYFKPIICMNNFDRPSFFEKVYEKITGRKAKRSEKCESINFTKFPIVENYKTISPASAGYGVLGVINTKDDTFEDAIDSQNKFVSSEEFKSDLYYRKHQREVCRPRQSSILITRQGDFELYSNPVVEYEEKYKLKYSQDAESKMKGCGCEEYFNINAPRREIRAAIYGKYERYGNKLYLIEYSKPHGSSSDILRKIELLEGDRCNFFVKDLIGKDIKIFLFEDLDHNITQIPFMNACKNPVIEVNKQIPQ